MSKLIGIATWNFQEGSLAERIRRFAGMGFGAVSLIASEAAALARGETPDVEEAILGNALGVAIHGGFAPYGEPIDEPVLLADFDTFTRWHTRTGALRTVNFDAASVPDGSGGSMCNADGMSSALKRMLEMSNGAGFTVGVEDWPRNSEHLTAVTQLRKFPHYGILIDLGHMNMRTNGSKQPGAPFSREAAQGYLDDIVVPVNELHIHNNDGVGDLHAPPEVGTADFPVLAGMLASKCPDCVSTVEIVPSFCGLSEPDAVQASVAALRFWREAF